MEIAVLTNADENSLLVEEVVVLKLMCGLVTNTALTAHISTGLDVKYMYMLQVNLFQPRSICSNLGQFVSTKVNLILQ